MQYKDKASTGERQMAGCSKQRTGLEQWMASFSWRETTWRLMAFMALFGCRIDRPFIMALRPEIKLFALQYSLSALKASLQLSRDRLARWGTPSAQRYF